MRVRTAIVASALCASIASLSIVESGCREEERAEEPRRSQRHETCQITNDCAEGLSCVPIPGGALGVCVTGSFRVAPTSRECAIIECVAAADCCDPMLTTFCVEQQAQCAADSGPNAQQACQLFQSQCGCVTGKTVCEEGKCAAHCTTDIDCLSSGTGRVCTAGKCAECSVTGNCPAGQQCTNGHCEMGCIHDGNCTGFDRCVAGRCLPSGCQTDRECVAASRNVDSICGTDGKCIIPCANDLECGDPASYNFFSCIDKKCTYVGCDSDKDCRLFYTGPTDASVLPPGKQVVCRDKSVIGDTTKSAPP